MFILTTKPRTNIYQMPIESRNNLLLPYPKSLTKNKLFHFLTLSMCMDLIISGKRDFLNIFAKIDFTFEGFFSPSIALDNVHIVMGPCIESFRAKGPPKIGPSFVWTN